MGHCSGHLHGFLVHGHLRDRTGRLDPLAVGRPPGHNCAPEKIKILNKLLYDKGKQLTVPEKEVYD